MVHMITHDNEYFYKYVSAGTAKAILRNRSVRWSSPLLFNDPFDIQFDLQIPFTQDEHHDAMLQKYIEVFRNGRNGPINTENPQTELFNRLLDLTRERAPDMTDEELALEFGPSIREGYSKVVSSLPAVHEEVRGILGHTCVFCVSTVPNSLLMWAHYADSHQGAVIKFRCLQERGTALCAATPVVYQEEMPPFMTLADSVASSFGEQDTPHEHLYHAMTATKGDEWAYENEWRAIGIFRTPEETAQGYSDDKIYPEEIVEVTLGCRIEDADRDEILKLIVGNYPHAAIRQAHTADKSFTLDYEEVT